jgi:hypothetical protein
MERSAGGFGWGFQPGMIARPPLTVGKSVPDLSDLRTICIGMYRMETGLEGMEKPEPFTGDGRDLRARRLCGIYLRPSNPGPCGWS